MSADDEFSKDVIPFPVEPGRGVINQQEEADETHLSGSFADRVAEVEAMRILLAVLAPLGEEGCNRVIDWIEGALDLRRTHRTGRAADVPSPRSDDRMAISPKAFIAAKKPTTAVELIACLAYYLAEHRDLEHFKTSDLTALNTEAACRKFGNASRDVADADRRNGYLVTAGNGSKQLTPRGEALVRALPDREAVKVALQEHPLRSRRPSGSTKRVAQSSPEEQ